MRVGRYKVVSAIHFARFLRIQFAAIAKFKFLFYRA